MLNESIIDDDQEKKVPTKVYVTSVTPNDGQGKLSFEESSIVVFTGANNVGKSQALKDIFNAFEGSTKPQIVFSNIETSFQGDIQYLLNLIQYKGGTYWIGGFPINKDLFRINWEQHKLRDITPFFVNYLSTEQRLSVVSYDTSFDPLVSNPVTSIQKMYDDDKLEAIISKLFHKAFNTSLIIDRCGSSKIPIYVGTNPGIDRDVEDRVSKSYLCRLRELPLLKEQGDGMKCFAGIIINSFTSDHSITLIDEPEAFLHPPQARLIGKILVDNTPPNHQLFISTHSADFLKGLLDSENSRVKIVQINRENDVNHLSLLSNDSIKSFWKDPILRYSNILNGLFHSQVVLCEADSDCRFYQAIVDSMFDSGDDISPDVLFTSCGGKHKFKAVIDALLKLNVRLKIIADMDILEDADEFLEIVKSLEIKIDDIQSHYHNIESVIKNGDNRISTQESKKKIISFYDTINTEDLSNHDIKELRKLIDKPKSDIKQYGVEVFKGQSRESYDYIDNQCRDKGLFIVPVGELECFDKRYGGHSTLWLNAVLENPLFSVDPELDKARQFMSGVLGIQ